MSAARRMVYPEDLVRRRGSWFGQLPKGWWTPHRHYEDVIARIWPKSPRKDGKKADEDQAGLILSQVAWEAGGRHVWRLDAASAFALAMTDPPDWWDDEDGMVAGVTGDSSCIYVVLPPELIQTDHGVSVDGIYILDSWFRHDDGTKTADLRVTWTSGTGFRSLGHIGPSERQQLVDELRARRSDHTLRAPALAWNLLAALRHTHSLSVNVATPPRASGTTARLEEKLGKTRVPHREIKLALAPTERPIGVVQEMPERGDAGDAGRTVAGHWVRGHWHRYWVVRLAEGDRPDATREEDGRVLHRVARWVKPYLSGDLAVAPRATANVRMVELPVSE